MGIPVNPSIQPNEPETPKVERKIEIIEINDDRKGGLVKCPQCGSSDIKYNIKSQTLVCQSCRKSWHEDFVEDEINRISIDELKTVVATKRALNIEQDNSVVTIKCSACGAEVVINTDENVQARCHWCRNFLSTDTQIQNGAIPDAVVPFIIEQETAVETIRKFVEKRKFFANPTFREEFEPENVVGVYLPYFVFDGNASASLLGQGEIETRSYTKKDSRGNEITYYDADVYEVGRNFDMTVDDMFIESSTERADFENEEKTNNIINAILPFDAKKAVKYNPNYLRGFTSERRNINADSLDAKVQDMLLSISRAKSDTMIKKYDRGVRWDYEKATLHGSRWMTVYLPIWLYSYYQEDKNLKHYVAVNGQNGQVMGSVPLNMPKLITTSVGVSIVGTILSTILLILS